MLAAWIPFGLQIPAIALSFKFYVKDLVILFREVKIWGGDTFLNVSPLF